MLSLKYKRRMLVPAAVLALAFSLLWPAYVNGEPFYMTDTSSYLRGADAAMHWLTGQRTAWSGEYFARFGSHPGKSLPAIEKPVVLAGRSIYYGLLLYAAQFLGNFWAVAILQASLVASSIAVTISVLGRALGREASPETTAASTLLVGAFLAGLTPVGYFCSYLMPDIFGALGLLAFAHLLCLWDQNSSRSRIFWFAMLLAALLFHAGNFLLVALLAAAAAVCLLLKLPLRKKGLASIAAALVVAFAGQLAFSWSVKHSTGAAPIRPPFIAARIIDDGPGYDYLREHCPQVKLIYCRVTNFRARASDSLLWSRSPQLGIFQAVTPSEQRIAAAEQNRFVLAVFAEKPLQLLETSAADVLRQLAHFDLDSFNYTTDNKVYFGGKLPRPFIDSAGHSRAFQGTMPVRAVELSTIPVVLLSLLLIGWRIWQSRRTAAFAPEMTWLSVLLLGVLLNAVICGALSTPKGRYQMRLIWVLPLAAFATQARQRGGTHSHSLELVEQQGIA